MTAPDQGPALARTALALLHHVEQFFEAARVPLNASGKPSGFACYVAAGEPRLFAWDREALVVSLSAITRSVGGARGAAIQQAGTPTSVAFGPMVTFAATLIRCTPSDGRQGMPSNDAIHGSGLAMMTDAGTLSQAVVDWGRTFDRETAVSFGPLVTLGPTGGFHGVEATVSVSADWLSGG